MTTLMKLRERQKHATRADILRAAAGLLAERGYEATTTRMVAEQAGVAIGTVFAHFADKPALVEALLAEHVDAALAEALGTLPEGDVVAELVHVATVLYAAYDREPDLSRVLVQASLFAADPDRPLARQLARFEAWVVARIGHAIATGAVPPIEPRLAFLSWFALYFALLVGGLRGDVPPAARGPLLDAALRRLLSSPLSGSPLP